MTAALRALAARAEAIEALLGLALVTTGVAMLSTAAALIVSGSVIFLLAVWPARRP